MKLTVDKSHKKVDLSKLKKPLKRISIGLLGTTIAISMYGGMTDIKVYAAETPSSTYTETIEDEIFIPEEFRYEIASKVDKSVNEAITKNDLKKIEYLFLTIDDENTDLSFLEYCTNLNILSLFIKTPNNHVLQKIPNISNIENISITNIFDESTITKEDLSFINQNPTIKSLDITGILVSPGCEEEINKVERLHLGLISNCDMDFTKLTNLKKLDLKSIMPYDLAIFLNSEEYNTLINNGVEIEFKDEWVKETYLNASETIDDIVKTLGVNKESTDEEKLNAILIYVLERLTYDEEVSNALSNGTNHEDLTMSFYENGLLYGALEKDTSICGNYTALVEALMDRLDVPSKSTMLTSNTHAWNLIMIDNEPYYVDATWLDGLDVTEEKQITLVNEKGEPIGISISYESKDIVELLKQGEGHTLDWYMENPDPEYISTIDKKNSHNPTYVPEYMTIVNNKQEEQPVVEEREEVTTTESTEVKEDIANEKVKIKIGTKEIIITAGALVGIMSALGVAIAVKKKKEEEKRRRRRQQQSMFDPYSQNPFDSNYHSRYR